MFGDKKEIIFGQEAKQQIQQGVNLLADAVSITLGPKGRNVILERIFNEQRVTKDGVSVAREIFFKDSLKNIGAQIIKAAANKTADTAGDGTTTSVVLSRHIINEAFKNIVAGMNSIEIKDGIEIASIYVKEELENLSIPVEDDNIYDVASISANNDYKIGEIIKDAIIETGKDGKILIEDSETGETYLKKKRGSVLEHGYISPYFVTTSEKIELKNPYILVTDHEISEVKDILGILKECEGKSLIIIANEIEKDALHFLIEITRNSATKVIGVRSPSVAVMRTLYLEDIAALTGATFITKTQGHKVERASIKHLGKCEKAIIEKDSTVLIKCKGNLEKIEQRKKLLKDKIKSSPGKLKGRHEKRYASLFGGIATLFVGASTEIEQKEKKDRIDDAICAVTAAIKDGILPGGGTALLKAAYLAKKKMKFKNFTTSEIIGMNIIFEACEQPFRQILKNAGYPSEKYIDKVRRNQKNGYNVRGSIFHVKDMIDYGIIDPTMVVKEALRNAVSVSTMLLITDAVIYSTEISDPIIDIDENEK